MLEWIIGKEDVHQQREQRGGTTGILSHVLSTVYNVWRERWIQSSVYR